MRHSQLDSETQRVMMASYLLGWEGCPSQVPSTHNLLLWQATVYRLAIQNRHRSFHRADSLECQAQSLKSEGPLDNPQEDNLQEDRSSGARVLIISFSSHRRQRHQSRYQLHPEHIRLIHHHGAPSLLKLHPLSTSIFQVVNVGRVRNLLEIPVVVGATLVPARLKLCMRGHEHHALPLPNRSL
jgi:hypothetical protein